MSKKLYRFNEHNVCLNPDEIIIGKHVMIEVAEYNGKWVSGHFYMLNLCGDGTPCSIKLYGGFSTKDEAIKFEIRKVIQKMNHEIEFHKDRDGWRSEIKRLKKYVNLLKQYLFDMTHVQLSLF